MNQHFAIRLGEISTTVMGQAPPGATCNTDGNGTIFVKAGEFGEREPIVREWTTKPLKMSRRGDVLVCVVGATAGKINLGIDCAIGRSVAAVRPEPAKLDTSYLYHFLATKVGELRARSQGLAQGVITREMLAELTVPLPPLDEQRRIATILDKADALRQKRKRTIAVLDGLTKSIFLEMFGDPVANPKKLPKRALQDLIRVKSGDGLTSAQMDESGTYLVYGGNGPNGRHSQYMFDEPVVTIGRVGVYCGAVHITEPKSWVTDNSLYVAEHTDALDLDYLADALKIADLNQYAGRAAQPLISGGRIYPVEILVAPMALQRQYATAMTQLRNIRNTASSDGLDGLFSSLQHRAFSGQL